MSSILVKQQSRFSVHLDALRGLAALAVFAGHLRALFFVEYPAVISPGILIKALYFLAGFGHQAVMIFFVLSGFLIASSVRRASEQNRWNLAWYAQNRLTRLYVVLIPALLLTALWDRLGMHMFGLNTVYGAIPVYERIISIPVPDASGPGTLLGNALFLQSIRVLPFGSDSPLWSLSNEFWYYVLFPVCLFVFASRLSIVKRLGAGILALGILVLVGREIALLFSVWLMGAMLVLLPGSGRKTTGVLVGVSLGLLLAALAAARLQKLGPPDVADIGVGFLFTLFLYSLRSRSDILDSHAISYSNAFVADFYRRPAQFFSRVSYTLYLIHLPFLFFITAWLIGSKPLWQPDGRHLILGTAIAATTFAYMLVIWRLTEANTASVRRFIQGRHLSGRKLQGHTR